MWSFNLTQEWAELLGDHRQNKIFDLPQQAFCTGFDGRQVLDLNSFRKRANNPPEILQFFLQVTTFHGIFIRLNKENC